MNKPYVLLLLTSLFLSGSVYANVEDECTSEESYTEKCRYFLEGYLYGISEVNDSTSKAKNKSSSTEETFAERAIRTRLGTGDLRKTGKKSTPLYCLPDLSEVVSIAKSLQKEFSENPEFWAEVNDPISGALQKIYPCKD